MVSLIALLWVLGISIVPGFEGRYAVFYILGKGFIGWEKVGLLLLAFLANFIIFLFVFLAFGILGWRGRLLSFIEKRWVRKKEGFERAIRRWGYFGLIIFIAVPIPGTGVYSGTILSEAIGLDRKRVVLCGLLGGLISMIITYFGYVGLSGLF